MNGAEMTVKEARTGRGRKEPTVRRQVVHRDSVKTRLCVFGVLALALVLCSVFSDRLCPYDPYLQDLDNALSPPSAAHLLGTDRYGRDLLSRVIIGSRTSVFSTLLLVSIITVLGTAAGVVCGWYGQWVDTVVMRISDLFLAFPGLVFALAVAGVLGGGLHNAILALAAISWPKYARIARSQTLTQKEAPYIRAARMAGSGTGQILFRHILPNILADRRRQRPHPGLFPRPHRPPAYSAEYSGADSGDFHAGHRDHDDGTGGAVLSGTGRETACGGVGKHDERLPQYAPDAPLGDVRAGICHFYFCDDF